MVHIELTAPDPVGAHRDLTKAARDVAHLWDHGHWRDYYDAIDRLETALRAVRYYHDRGTGAINHGEPQIVTLSGGEYERYLCGALNEPLADIADTTTTIEGEAGEVTLRTALRPVAPGLELPQSHIEQLKLADDTGSSEYVAHLYVSEAPPTEERHTMEPTPRHPSVAHFAQLFAYSHLPPHLQEISRPFADMHDRLLDTLRDGIELSAALRKLVEAKDCAVRQAVIDWSAANPSIPVDPLAGTIGTIRRNLAGDAAVDRPI